MKKKICLLLCVLCAVFCMVGCSEKTVVSQAGLERSKYTAEYIVELFSNYTEKEFEYYQGLSEYELTHILDQLYSTTLITKTEFLQQMQMQYGSDVVTQYQDVLIEQYEQEYGPFTEYPIILSEDVFMNMMRSWQASIDECGAYKGLGDFDAEVKSDEIIVSAKAQYANRDATISFTFDDTGIVQSMDVSAEYTTGEIMSKAGMNTLLGMGTVFAVLIFLAILIWCMKYISVIQNLFKKKAKSVTNEVSTLEEISDNIVEAVTDDLELIAVITAAIAAQEGTSTDGFVVRSIRRRPSNNWN